MTTVRELPLIEVKGSRRERGQQHGEACRESIAALVASSTEDLHRRKEFTLDALGGEIEGVIESVERFTPWLMEECEGIASGSDCKIHEIVYLQCRFEMLHRFDREGACTVIGIGAERTNGKGPLVAQNIDLPPFNLESMILLKSFPDRGPRTLSVTFAGILSQEGINSDGLALCGSHVLSKDWCNGYPARNFLRRHLFEQSDIERAEKELRAVLPRGSGHNIVLADGTGKIVNFEITPHTYRANPVNPAGILVHTNHYIHPELHDLDWFKAHDPIYYENSQKRLGRGKDLLNRHDGVISFDVIRRVLSDHHDEADAICRHAKNDRLGNSSVVSLIGVPREGELCLIPGNPCEGIWKAYRL